jgi:hypothetical protein
MEETKSEKVKIKFNRLETHWFSGMLNTLIAAQTIPLWLNMGVMLFHFAILIPAFYDMTLFLERKPQIPILIKQWGLLVTTLLEFSFFAISIVIIGFLKPVFLEISP